MKTAILTKKASLVIAIISMFVFIGCTAESTDAIYNEAQQNDTEQLFSLTLEVYNNGIEEDATQFSQSATLFIFNENNDFVKDIDVTNETIQSRRPTEFTISNAKRVTVVAWSGLNKNNEQITALTKANIIEDLTVSLKQNNGFANNPGNLYYGQVTLSANSTKAEAVGLKIERKTETLSLRTIGIEATSGNYYYVIKQSRNGFDHNGSLVGNEAIYKAEATIANGQIILDAIQVLPTAKFDIELYCNDELVFTAQNVQKESNISANGELTAFFTFNMNGSSLAISTADWKIVNQVMTI